MIPCVIEFFEDMSGGFCQLRVVHRKVRKCLYVSRFVFSLFDDLVKGTYIVTSDAIQVINFRPAFSTQCGTGQDGY